MEQNKDHWTIVIKPQSNWYKIDLKEVWNYRDLIMLFVKRDFVSQYKQTILGPLWLIIQPLLSVLVFSVIFGVLAKLPTHGVPRLLFYLSAFVPWTYFSDCFSKNSSTFMSNASIFGKVYFPRLVKPVSVTISNLYKFGIQLILFFVIYFVFFVHGFNGTPRLSILLIPFLVLFPALYGLALGIIVSSLTTKYRDLNFITGVLIQVFMYASSIVFSIIDVSPNLYAYLKWNPLVWIMEAFRYSLVGVGVWSWSGLAYSLVVLIFLLVIALLVFKKTENNFIDVV
jgi:lipopolysaccharide transport system permease protein